MILARTTLLGLVVLLASASCGGAVTIRGPSAACPLDVTGPADLLVCYPGDFDINGVASNERGVLVMISTHETRADFGGLHVVEPNSSAVLDFDSEGALRWHADGGCQCGLAVAPDGSAVVADKRGVSWVTSSGERFTRPLPSSLRGLVGLSFSRDGTTIAATVDRNPSEATVSTFRLGRDGVAQLLASAGTQLSHSGAPEDFAIDDQAVWTGTMDDPGVGTTSIGPRGVVHVPFASKRQSSRSLSRGGVFFHGEGIAWCAPDVQNESSVLAILQDGRVGWSYCAKALHSWIVDGDATSSGLVVAGQTLADGTLDGRAIGGSRDGSSFVARLGFDGTVGSLTRVDSPSVDAMVRHVQVLADGRILAIGSFRGRAPERDSTQRPFPFEPAPSASAPLRGAFIVRTR